MDWVIRVAILVANYTAEWVKKKSFFFLPSRLGDAGSGYKDVKDCFAQKVKDTQLLYRIDKARNQPKLYKFIMHIIQTR